MNAIPEQHLSRIVLPVIAAAVSSTALLLAGTNLWVSSIVLILISNFAQLPLFLVGLRYGSFPAFLAGTLSAVLVGYYMLSAGDASNFVKLFLNVLLWNTIPVAVLTHLAFVHRIVGEDLKIWSSAGLMIAGLTGLAYVLILSMPLMNGFSFGATHSDHIEQALVQSLAGIPMEQADHILETFHVLMPFLPGIQVISWMMMIVFNGLMAQSLLQKTKKSIRLSLSLIDVYVPTGFLIVLAVSGVLGYFFFGQQVGQIAANIAIVTLVPYFIMGLGTLRSFAQSKSYGQVFMGIAYFLIIITPALTAVVAMLGIFEPWLNLRNKLLQQK